MIEKIKTNIKYILAFIILIVIIIIFIIYYLNNLSDDNIEKEDNHVKKIVKKEEKKEEDFYYVDIKGAVKNPGVYKLKENSRVIDVINASGGLNENADTSIINLSKKIFDEMFIIIYTKEEIAKYKEKTISTSEINKELEKNILVIDENNSANIKNKSKNNTSNKEDIDEEKLVNINSATKEELLTITGIGESKADAIISYREENGNFNSIEDIKNVSGIGDSLFEKIKDYITV